MKKLLSILCMAGVLMIVGCGDDKPAPAKDKDKPAAGKDKDKDKPAPAKDKDKDTPAPAKDKADGKP